MAQYLIRFARNFDYAGRPAALCSVIHIPNMRGQLYKTLHLKTCPYCHGMFYGKDTAVFCCHNCSSSIKSTPHQAKITIATAGNWQCSQHGDIFDLSEAEAKELNKNLHRGRYWFIDTKNTPKRVEESFE